MNLPDIFILAETVLPPGSAEAPITVEKVVWMSILILALIALNGFFVAAEFALVKVRQSQLDEILDDNSPENRSRSNRARVTKHILSKLNAYLSACQLGITLVSLALGQIAEPFVEHLLSPWFGKDGLNLSPGWFKFATFVLALGPTTALHVIIGEQLPKMLAISKALNTALWCARPLRIFYGLFKWAVMLLNAISDRLLRWFFKIEPTGEHDVVHSADELKLLVSESQREEEVTQTEEAIVTNALALSELEAKNILTPRARIVALDINEPFKVNLKTAIQSQHTRFPVVDRDLEKSLGLVHIKDLLGVIDQPNPDLKAVVRALHAVPVSMPLDKLLTFFLEKHTHLALVVDELGTAVGMVTLDDVIEELVGEIQDEFDKPDIDFQRINDEEFTVDGSMPLHDLAEQTDLDLESEEVSTIGGYVTNKIGHLPSTGETLELENYDVAITKADGRRIIQLHFRRRPASVEDGTTAE